MRPLTGSKVMYLRSNSLDAGWFKDFTGFVSKDSSGSRYLQFPAKEGWLKGQGLDMTGIRSIELMSVGGSDGTSYDVEVRLDGTGNTSRRIGSAKINAGKGPQATYSIPVEPVGDGSLHDVYIIFRPVNTGTSGRPFLKTIRFTPQT